MTEPIEHENIAQTLARELPTATVLFIDTPNQTERTGSITHVALPDGFKLQSVDNEALLANPRRTKAAAQFSDADSFIAYVNRHAEDGTTVWCNFNPQTFALNFEAVIDEHHPALAGWRGHKATFEPAMSAEWKAWMSSHAKSMPQVAFAEWLEEHEDDITSSSASLPTSLQMKQMATEFVANEERALKSSVKLQSGGVRLTYIADPDAGTTASMQMVERFAIGIPVFHGGSAWSLTSRLKYRLNNGKVNFHYELVRPDRVHEGAAKELIERIKSGVGAVPLLMGACA